MSSPKRVVILGAGISGLSLAWYLRNKYDVVLAEASDRPGGWIRTHQQEGFLFEGGPHSFRTEGHGTTLVLIDELGLTPDLITANTTDQFLFYQQRLHQVPKGIFSLLTSRLTRDLLPSLCREWNAPKALGEESVQAFAERRLGASIAARFVDPMVSGIYAGDPSKLSVSSCFPKLCQMERNHGSLIKALLWGPKSPPSKVMSLKGGMQSLTDRLAELLKNQIHFGKSATQVTFGKEVEVLLADGSTLTADHLYAAIPAWQMAKLLPIPQLKQIPFSSVVAVSLGYKKNILSHRGFGYLVPNIENKKILGVIWDSCVFPQQNRHSGETRVTVMMGGTRQPDLLDWCDQELIALACREVSEVQPDASLVVRAHRAIPQYELGFMQLRNQIEQLCPESCTLLGNSYFGVSINDCIQQAFSQANDPVAFQKRNGSLR